MEMFGENWYEYLGYTVHIYINFNKYVGYTLHIYTSIDINM